MSDIIYSPDGEHMWTGSEWIPVPPVSSGSTIVNMADSVIAGDVSIVNNDPAEVVNIVIKTLGELGITSTNTTPYLIQSKQGTSTQND